MEVLLTMVMAREHWNSIPLPLHPCQVIAETLQHVSGRKRKKKKKEVRKNDCVSINKARYPALRGVDSASTSLIITIQRKNELVNSVTTWKTGLW